MWKMEENLQYFFLTFTLLSANCHSAPCCRLDTSLLSAVQQGAERRPASKVKRLTFELMGFAFWLKKRWQEGEGTKEKEEKVAEKLRLLRKMYYLCKQVSANRRKRRKLRLIP